MVENFENKKKWWKFWKKNVGNFEKKMLEILKKNVGNFEKKCWKFWKKNMLEIYKYLKFWKKYIKKLYLKNFLLNLGKRFYIT